METEGAYDVVDGNSPVSVPTLIREVVFSACCFLFWVCCVLTIHTSFQGSLGNQMGRWRGDRDGVCGGGSGR